MYRSKINSGTADRQENTDSAGLTLKRFTGKKELVLQQQEVQVFRGIPPGHENAHRLFVIEMFQSNCFDEESAVPEIDVKIVEEFKSLSNEDQKLELKRLYSLVYANR